MRTSRPFSTARTGRARVGAVLALAFACSLVIPAGAYAEPGDGGGRDKVVFGESGEPQPQSNADQNPGGANNGGDCGAYCSTRDGSLAQNGQARSGHEAGSKGAADNKYPPGQAPDGTDHNNGYECDGNNGVGVSNPAHTGCGSTPPPPPPQGCVAGDTVTVTWGGVVLGDPSVSGLVETATTGVSLLPGTYTVQLTSRDANHAPGHQTNQQNEQWFVVLTLAGDVVATTDTISDLPDASTTLTEPVGEITLTEGADVAVATHLHADSATWPSPESVEPTSAVFTCV